MWRGIKYGCSATCGVLGAYFGYRFGVQISGPGLGILVGLNAAIFAALVVGMALDRLSPSSPAQPCGKLD